ncbi:RNA polymerase sigma factor [Wenyingzhuangia sp. 2_MG-2023]|uniref:RNA polymerase sigma factor n=1 Tax=Wenyingzhuangia sp. 2_MG-2023 TaxID=3062639 RepID=UPI0026E17EFF|nr:RNA polymerase sigma-70 factor [Wenyingzhuangia sp. 2_MG-2023]MDO6738862.1 RNA polymerase sigma-70 factor [Wenyingzhuangia sp. 2_MG-2023]
MINIDKDTTTLIEKLIDGDEKAYLSLIEIYYKKLYVYAYSLTNDYALAEDIVQNVFMKIWENRKKLNIKESLKSFLYKAVYNDFVNSFRKKQSSLLLDKIYWETINEMTDEEYFQETASKIELLKKEIESLPNKCKQIFLLSKEEGLTNVEIASYLDVSIKSVEAHITNAYHILRKKIEIKKEGGGY